MPRVTTVLFVCGALSLGFALLGVPGLAEERAPQTVLAEGGFKTADGEGAAFRQIRATGEYQITEDAVTVRFTLTDRRRDGWTAGVQFATGEAWDEHHSPVFHPVGDPAAPGPGRLRGPRMAEATPRDRPACHGCRVLEPRKRKGTGAPADGVISYRFPKSFTSAFTEGLWAREVLIKKEGGRTVLRPGRTVTVYRAPVGTVLPGAQREAPLPLGSRFANDLGGPLGFGAVSGRKGRGGPVPFSAKEFPGGPEVSAEPWGEAERARRRGGGGEARTLLRIRDLAEDRRLPGVIVTFTDEDGRRIDTWTYWNSRDSSGRWTSRMAVNKLSGHLFYRACVGTQSHRGDQWAFEPVSCGETRQVY
ncbi:hypothetical protein EDD29_7573 [Actinocorallia herbida]|uniref:Uncharacterized protein n=1 Tax=Actinocorallia herbida TaxID=58109 RepID=A0A3N1D8K2_9ACTN|nr:hypothetical protein [Actinocorallia herbida]ROO89864.1 hypothetical protein EDD29_7573 [Actinocorallia herbida]